MEALTIREANLDVLEQNMQAIAQELTSVMDNMASVHNAVNNMDLNVNKKIENIVDEVKMNTVINNARQNIMYNNSIIDKKYGYYDKLRRNVESVIEGLEYSNLDRSTINNLKQDILVNNPRYWLSPATLSLLYWLLNDRKNSEKELGNALRKNKEKTSMFFLLNYLKLGRMDTSIHWLKYYLNSLDPTALNEDFVVILELVANGSLGIEGERILINKIDSWLSKINTSYKDKQVENWKKHISEYPKKDYTFAFINNYANNDVIIKHNLSIVDSYANTMIEIDNILNRKNKTIELDKIMYDLIYNYEEVEKEFKNENLKNELIIKYNGDMEEANKVYKEKIKVETKNINILDLFMDILFNEDKYNASLNIIKIAFVYQKEYLKEAYNQINKTIKNAPLSIEVDDFSIVSKDGSNLNDINKELDIYIDTKYKIDDKSMIVILIIVNILGLAAILLSSKFNILNYLIIFLIFIINIILIMRLSKKEKVMDKEKDRVKKQIMSKIEASLAEITDYFNLMNDSSKYYNIVVQKIDEVKIENLLNSQERRIDSHE